MIQEKINGEFFIKKTIVYYTEPSIIERGLIDTYDPITVKSVNYKNMKGKEINTEFCGQMMD